MALTFDLTKTQLPKNEQGGLEWGDHTENIIWATLAVNMGEITEANVEEFHHRVILWHRMNGQPEFPSFTLEDLRVLIGLRTNVTTKTWAQWWARMGKLQKDDRSSALRDHDEYHLPRAQAERKARMAAESTPTSEAEKV